MPLIAFETKRWTGNLCLAPIGGHLPRSRIPCFSGENPSVGQFPRYAISTKGFRESVASWSAWSPTRKERRSGCDLVVRVRVAIAMTPLSRKGNKRRVTNRRGWRQRHVAAVLCSSRFVSLESRGHEKKKEKSREEKGEKWCLLIPQDRNPTYVIRSLDFYRGIEIFTYFFSILLGIINGYNFSHFILFILLFLV